MNGNDDKIRHAIRLLDTDTKKARRFLLKKNISKWDREMGEYKVRVNEQEMRYLRERLRRRERPKKHSSRLETF